MDEYQRRDLLLLRSAPNYRAYLGDLCAPHVRGRHVLEIGAGLGDLGRQLLQHGPSSLTLAEPGEECYAELATIDQPGVETTRRFSHELARDSPGRWDTIIYSNVLEHIEDDAAELRTAARLLAPVGRLLVIVPAHQALYAPIDRRLLHFRRYSRSSLVALVDRVGQFETESCIYINKLGVAGWLLNKSLGRDTQSDTLFALFDRWVLPISRRLDKVAPRSFGLSLVAVLRRRP